jgi:hypothetical protein
MTMQGVSRQAEGADPRFAWVPAVGGCAAAGAHAGVYRATLVAAVAWLTLAACGESAPRAALPVDSAAGPAAVAAAPADAPDADHLIRADGIGRVRAGMTFGELRARLADDLELGSPTPYMVDFDGLPVVAGTDTLYHVLVESGSVPGDAEPVTLVATQNPTVRTAEGVGPGTTLADAARVYGAPTLSFSVNDESREYARFPRYDTSTVRFRVFPASENSSQVGRYATEGEYNETTVFDPTGRIRLVIVDLRR